MADTAVQSIHQPYFRPLIPLLFALMGGIAAAHCFPGRFKTALILFFAAGVATAYCRFLNQPARLSPLLLYIAAGYLCLCPWQLNPRIPNHINSFLNETDKTWQITGTIDTEPRRKSYRLKFILADILISDKLQTVRGEQVRGKLRVTVYGQGELLRVGDRITFNSKLRPFHNFNNPGGFDYKSFMAYKNIWASAYASGNEIQIQAGPPANPAVTGLANVRQSIRNLIKKSAHGDSRAILSTLLLGDRDLISSPLGRAFNRAGVSHVLAISGLHVGIVGTFAFILFKHLLTLYRPLLYRGWTRKGAAALAILPVLAYGLIAGMSPSTQRAVIMVSLFLLSFWIERDHDITNTLAAAALIILIIYPPSLFSISFQLSFTAVAAILFGLTAIQSQGLIPNNPKISPPLTFMAVSFFAILGTTPLIMHYFNQAAFLGILTNLLIIPLIGFLVVPLALFSVLVLFPLHLALAGLGLKAAGAAIQLALLIINPVGNWPYSAAKTVTLSSLELVCLYICFFSVLVFIRSKGLRPKREDFKHPAALLMITASLVLAADISYWCHDRFWADRFRATIIDVGQGSATLLELPDGYRMLIDGGGFSTNAVFDVGENVVAPFLWDRKIASIDAVVLSHPDADHLNGLVYILNHFHVQKVLSTHLASDSREYEAFLQAIEKEHISHPAFGQIPRQFSINRVRFDILYPPPDMLRKPPETCPNNLSLVLKATYNGHSILLPGDIMKAAEKALIAEAENDLTAAVLVAPHHGSKTSSTQAFLECVEPEAVIVSAGPQNRFDLPAPSIIEKYRKMGCSVLMTNRDGAVEVRIGNDHIDLAPVCGTPLRIEPIIQPDKS